MITAAEYRGVVTCFTHELRNFFLSRGVSQADSDDLMQETFRVLWEKCESLVPEKTKFFLFGVARNILKAYWRERLKDAKRNIALQQSEETTVPGPDHPCEAAERADRLNELLEGLAPRQRDVMRLVYTTGISMAGAARSLGISPDAARTHHNRALKKLREMVRENTVL